MHPGSMQNALIVDINTQFEVSAFYLVYGHHTGPIIPRFCQRFQDISSDILTVLVYTVENPQSFFYLWSPIDTIND
jgi:hypothetical protein